MKKNTIRACVRRLAADMDAAERQLESQRATDLLERAVRRRGAAVVALFSPLPDEIDIAPLAARLGGRTHRAAARGRYPAGRAAHGVL